MNRPNRLLMVTLLAAAVLAPPAAAQGVEAGRQIARNWCSSCHEIGNAQVQNNVGPPFMAIARMSSTTTISLNAFLSTPHNRMPNYRLTRQEIADVSAYILSLRGPPR